MSEHHCGQKSLTGRGADMGPMHRSVLSQSTLKQAGLQLKMQGDERAKWREVN